VDHVGDGVGFAAAGLAEGNDGAHAALDRIGDDVNTILVEYLLVTTRMVIRIVEQKLFFLYLNFGLQILFWLFKDHVLVLRDPNTFRLLQFFWAQKRSDPSYNVY